MAAKKILMLVGDYAEDYETMVPFQAFLMVGHAVHAACPGKKADIPVDQAHVDGNLVTAAADGGGWRSQGECLRGMWRATGFHLLSLLTPPRSERLIRSPQLPLPRVAEEACVVSTSGSPAHSNQP